VILACSTTCSLCAHRPTHQKKH